VKNKLEESHDFMKLPCMSSGFTLTIDNPASSNNSSTFSFHLSFLNKVDSSEDSVFEEGLFVDSFRE